MSNVPANPLTQTATNAGRTEGRSEGASLSREASPTGSEADVPEGLGFNNPLSRALNEIVDSFKNGLLSKSLAIARLARLLPAPTPDSSTEPELDLFVSMLESHEAHLARALERSRGPDRPSEIDDRGARDVSVAIGNGGSGGDAGNSLAFRNRKRASDFDEDDPAPEVVESFVSNKKPKIFEQDQPWFSNETVAQSFLSPSLMETRRILRGFSGDIPAIKRWISTAASVPFMPDSEWDSIVRGRSINLDLVISGIYSTTPVTDNTERIGTLEFRVAGSSEPTKVIRTHGEWAIAWSAAVDATTFCFPHRASELRLYGESITRMFMALGSSSHPRIFNYDKAVRARVGQLNNLLLTDFGAFADLKMQWIDVIGVAGGEDHTSSRSSKRTSNNKTNDVCNRFNRGNCPDSAGRCRWKHVCRECKKSGHGANNCTAGNDA